MFTTKKFSTIFFLGYLESAFEAIEHYSPFHQFMQTDEEFLKSLKRSVPEKEDDLPASPLKIFTKVNINY